MSVASHHQQYDKHIAQWRRCEDAIEGQDAIKNGGVVYLPKLGGQEDADYASYLSRALFFNAAGRTVDALTGLVNAKPAVFVGPEALDVMMVDVTLSGITIEEFANEVMEKVIGVGRCGILVDYPTVNEGSLTLADARRLNLRPYARIYKASDIINWRQEWVNGREVLTLVVIDESECVYTGYSSSWVMQKRVLELVNGVYVQSVWRKDDKGDYAVWQTFQPMMRGKPLTEIPFRFINVETSRCDCETAPLLDLVDTNIAHYRNSADYEHGLHFTGLPQPYVSGVQLADGTKLNIGSPSAWVFSDPQASAGYLEFQGQGLKALADAIAAKERKMAVLGARMLADEKAAAEAVEAIEMRFSGENSVLTSIANSVSLGLTWMLKKMAEWEGIAFNDISYKLNTDYNLKQMSPQMITALVGAWQAGMITHESAFLAMQRGEIISVVEEFSTYQKKADEQKPKPQESVESQGFMSSLRNRIGL